MDIKQHFDLVFEAFKKEDLELRKGFERPIFDYAAKDCDGIGIGDLYEKPLQYIVFKALLLKGGLQVYLEDSYGRGKRKCDVTLYGPKSNKAIWIEIKVTGWCYDWQFKKWISDDAKKLKQLRNKNAGKYLLVTSIEEEKPNPEECKNWFNESLPMLRFSPSLFKYFRTKFSDGEQFKNGYYTVSLLRVK